MGLLNVFCRSREFRETLERARPRLYRVAYAWCHNRALADDLVQDTLTKALQRADQLREPAAQEAWLFSILANCYRDHFRRERDTVDIDDVELPHERSPEFEHQEHEIVRKVRAAIATLSEGQRQVVTLVDLEGFSYVEVAQILNIPSGTVMSRLARARAALKETLIAEAEPARMGQGTIRRIK